MKKTQILFTCLLAFAMALSINSYAQFGVRAGFGFNNATYKDMEYEDYTKMKTGFHVGVTYDITVADQFAVQPGLLFAVKGGKIKASSSEGTYSFTHSPYYLEVPINFIYKPVLGSGNLLLGGGPYVAYGVGGKWKEDDNGEKDNGSLEFINDWDDESDDIDKVAYGKPFDAGLNLLAGYELSNKLSFQLNAGLGLLNLMPKDGGEKPNSKMKNSGFSISIGYKF
ncbi:MAG: porin family protein [Niabella sp.]